MDFAAKIGPEVDRERLIEELIKLKALISGFFESVPGTFIVLDSQWRLVHIKGDVKKNLIVGEASFIGKPLEEVFLKGYGYLLSREFIEPLLNGKDTSITRYSNLLHKWFKISAYESDPAIFIRLEDVTQEVMLNRLLRLNEFSVNRAMDMVFWVKPGGHIINVNIALCRALKYLKEELVKMKMPDIDPSLAGPMWSMFVEGMKYAGSRAYESSLLARDGSVIPVEVTCSYLIYNDDEYMIAFARDITARKRSEKALLEARDQAELYLDLMGHDISNMHQIALSQLELAQETMADEGRLEGGEKELIDTPIEALKRSAMLIDNVRKLQKLRAGEYKEEAMDLGILLAGVARLYSGIQEGIVTINYTPVNGCYVGANPLLKDVFTNLVDNAVKHSNGHVTINIGVGRIVDGGSVFYRVTVDDDGPGIPDEKKKEVFHRLKRGQTMARGTGLGLYIVKTLVESFHGRVTLEDRVPGDYTLGARFIVDLPVRGDEHGE
jgi:PAS domain S-box-containing protein